jgi:hypothetical protein
VPFATSCENVAIVKTVMVYGALDWARLLRVFFVWIWYGIGRDRSDIGLLFMMIADVVSKSLVSAMDGVKGIRFALLDYGLGLFHPMLEAGRVMCQMLWQRIAQNISSQHVGHFLMKSDNCVENLGMSDGMVLFFCTFMAVGISEVPLFLHSYPEKINELACLSGQVGTRYCCRRGIALGFGSTG